MLVVGLTGGMGSGKSTVARLFAELGAEVVDADAVAREVVAPGEPALAEIRDRFGDDILLADGSLDRAALAAIVFDDAEERRALEAITHPRIHSRIRDRLDRLERQGVEVVVLDHPLLVETGQHEEVDTVVVVTAPEDVRVRRLAEGRDIDPADARARLRAQAGDDERVAVADHVIDNGGELDALQRQVEQLWERLRADAA